MKHNPIEWAASHMRSLPNPIFVFGSNTKGIHGAGAARHAASNYGAVPGIGHGERGQSYALPTKWDPSTSVSPEELERFIVRFLVHARRSPTSNYVVTPIGTGLAGFTPDIVRSKFSAYDTPPNVHLDPSIKPDRYSTDTYNTVGSPLSNFYESPGISLPQDPNEYPSVEHAYQAAKTPDLALRRKISSVIERDPYKMGRAAKSEARRLALPPLPEPEKLALMANLLSQKFSRDKPFFDLLALLKHRSIAEVAPWDAFWGTGRTGKGLNHLGRLLTQIRDTP